MALTDETNTVMPVQPMNYGNNGGFGFGGDWAWILLLLVLGGGWGGFGGFGMGGFGGAMMGAGMMGIDYLYPWLNNSEHISDGFRDAQLHDSVTSIRDGVQGLSTQLCNCCGDMQMSLANGFNGVNNSEHISDGFRDAQLHDSVTSIRDGVQGLSTQLCNCCGDMQMSLANGFNGVNNSIFGAQSAITAQMNANELANLERSFAAQTATAQGFNGVQAQLAQNGFAQQAGTADLKYTIATENCADRYEAAQNTRDIIDSQTRGTQAILDKLCALELDGVKGQLAQAQRDNVALQNAVNMATMRESQTAQTAAILAGQTAEVDALYNRLKNCPVNAVPVAGNTPLFTCNPGFNSSGCGCNGGF